MRVKTDPKQEEINGKLVRLARGDYDLIHEALWASANKAANRKANLSEVVQYIVKYQKRSRSSDGSEQRPSKP